MVLVVPGSGASVETQVADLVRAWCGDPDASSGPTLPPGVREIAWRAADPGAGEPANSAVWAVAWEAGGDAGPRSSPTTGGDSFIDLATDLTGLAADLVSARTARSTHDETARTYLLALVAGIARRTGGQCGTTVRAASSPARPAAAWVVLLPACPDPDVVASALGAADPTWLLAMAGSHDNGWDASAGDLVLGATAVRPEGVPEWTQAGAPTVLPWRALATATPQSWTIELSVEPDEPRADDLPRGTRAAAVLAAALGGGATDAEGFPLGV